MSSFRNIVENMMTYYSHILDIGNHFAVNFFNLYNNSVHHKNEFIIYLLKQNIDKTRTRFILKLFLI